MTHLGRYRLGDRLPLVLRCLNAGEPEWPGGPPVVTVYAPNGPAFDAGLPVDSFTVGADDVGAVTGLFRRAVFLGPKYSGYIGRYTAVARWADGDGAVHAKLWTFDLIDGGSAAGDVIAAAVVDRPRATFVLHQRYDGSLARGMNPR